MKHLLIVISIFNFTSIVAQESVSVKIHSRLGYEGFEEFSQKASEKLEAALNSNSFKQAVLNGQFTNTNGLSNNEILTLIMVAQEIQGPGGERGVVDLRVRTLTLQRDGRRWMRNCKLNSWAKTIGIDGQGDGVTAICPERLRLWSSTNDYAQLAGHYAHEYMHIIGFSHPGRNRNQSLVYQIGNIVSKIIKDGI